MLVDFFRAFVKCTYAHADDVLAELSERYVAAAKELGLHHVPMMLCVKHGRLSSDHYRSLANVFEVIICDLANAEEAKTAVHDVVAWYWASRCTSYNDAYLTKLRALGVRMRESMAFFETDAMRALYREETKVHVSSLDDVPKVHRVVKHVPDYMRDFGPFEDLTTEASEAANKPLKQIFRAYVHARESVIVAVRDVPAAAVCVCVRA